MGKYRATSSYLEPGKLTYFTDRVLSARVPTSPDTRAALETYFETLDQRNDLPVKSPFASENVRQTSGGRVLCRALAQPES